MTAGNGLRLSGSAAGLTLAAALMCFNAADSGAANDITGQIGATKFFFFLGGWLL